MIAVGDIVTVGVMVKRNVLQFYEGRVARVDPTCEHFDVTISCNGRLSVRWHDEEGVRWCRGHDGLAVEALRVAQALR